MVDYDMTGENVSDEVLVFSDDSDNEVAEPAEETEEMEDEDGKNMWTYPESCSMFKHIQSIGVVTT